MSTESNYVINASSAPNQTIRIKQLLDVQRQGAELFKRKNADYGDAFAKYGAVGVMMRINDKIERFISVSKNGVTLVNTEKLSDTLLDLHNYAAMALMLIQENEDLAKTKETPNDVWNSVCETLGLVSENIQTTTTEFIQRNNLLKKSYESVNMIEDEDDTETSKLV